MAVDPQVERLCARLEALAKDRGPRLDLDAAVSQVRSRLGVDLRNARARAGFARGHLLDVALFVPGGRGPADEPAARQLVELLLGPATFRDWIGEIRCAATPRGILRVLDNQSDERTFPLAELCPAVDAAIRGLYEGLPEKPWYWERSEPDSVVFELEVEPALAYAAQDDVALVSTCLPEMLHCFLRGTPFASLRFSRHGELFAYLKYESARADLASAVERRDAIEQRLNQALLDARAGRVIGRGIGLAYAYLDLAISDVRASIAIAKELADEHLPEQSWLLFCDSELGDEWVGLKANTQSPP
ncbi:MAG TPA: hypothetical protein VGP93_13510 [Polyangiaceae bacterium]|jgi:tetrahydromethanopterin S-methyltransferase subunit G|nr:hypothetical protein [Polyangiaceae bacterium]